MVVREAQRLTKSAACRHEVGNGILASQRCKPEGTRGSCSMADRSNCKKREHSRNSEVSTLCRTLQAPGPLPMPPLLTPNLHPNPPNFTRLLQGQKWPHPRCGAEAGCADGLRRSVELKVGRA